jgi:hypothetical protein
MAQLVFPRAQVWGDVAAISRSDAAYARHFFASGADRGSLIGSPGTELIWAGGRILDAWPANPDENEYTHVQDSNVETLLIGGNLDFATPPQNATRALLPHLANGRQVVLSNLGHTDDFWAYEPAAGTRLLTTFLDSGKVDTSVYTPNKIDFSPSFTQGAIAKIVLGVLLGLAALTVLSLLWMSVRLCRRASFGRKGSVAVRSLYAGLLGIGGWCLGAFVVLTALPTVPVDDQALVVISVGVPVGLAVYCGWLNRDSLPVIKIVGATAAFGTAILGAWLGYHVPATPLLGALTGAFGAVAAANLALIALDVARTGERRETIPSVAIPAVEH